MSNVHIPKRQIDFSKVDRSDRVYVKNIILGVLAFEDPMPPLSIQIFAPDDHYNIAFIGWDQEIDDQKWFETFLKTSGHDKRENKYDYVISTSTVPTPNLTYKKDDERVDTGPVKLFRIKRGAFDNARHGKKRK